MAFCRGSHAAGLEMYELVVIAYSIEIVLFHYSVIFFSKKNATS